MPTYLLFHNVLYPFQFSRVFFRFKRFARKSEACQIKEIVYMAVPPAVKPPRLKVPNRISFCASDPIRW